MNNKNIHEKLEELAKSNLRIPSLDKSNASHQYHVSIRQIEKALREAYLLGEKLGYKHGFDNGKKACDCSLEDVEIISKMVVDTEKVFG